MNLVILISNAGTGTNLKAIIDGVNSGRIKARITAVVSDKEGAPGLKHAQDNNLPIKICPKKENLLPLLKKLQPDYICLAGWKQIILDEVILAFPNKILNLHPGLIPDAMDGKARPVKSGEAGPPVAGFNGVKNPDDTPALWNKGLLTDKAIQNFIDKKASYAGSSIHFLTLEFDFGPVLGRAFEKIEKDDTVESLYTRLKQKENQLYIEVLQNLSF